MLIAFFVAVKKSDSISFTRNGIDTSTSVGFASGCSAVDTGFFKESDAHESFESNNDVDDSV